MELLLILLIVLLLAHGFAEICRLLRLPRVVGQIMVGIILGTPFVSSWVLTNENMEIITSLADIGIILLFFFVGLEINLLEFEKNARESLKISMLNISIPFILGIALSLSFGLPKVTALLIGVALSVSAQSISIDFLEEMKMLKSRVGQLIITAGTVDDLIELILVSVVLAMLHTAIGGTSIILLLGSILLFIVLVLIARAFLIPKALKYFEQSKNETSLFTGGLIITLIMAVFSEKLGLGSLIGALIGGVLVRQILVARGTKQGIVQTERMTSIMRTISFGFLVPIFFVWVGLNTNLSGIIDNLWFTLAITVIAFVGTIGGTVLGVLWSKGSRHEGYIVGWGGNPKGDVELVVASLALQKGIISSSIFSSIIFMAFVTTLVSPIVFRWLVKNYSTRESASTVSQVKALHAKKS